MGKFKKGLVFGGLLGAGLMWLSTTKKGREVREQIFDYAADVYAEVKEKVTSSEQFDKMTKNKYVSLVRETVDKYAVKNGLANNAKNMIVKLVSSQWKNIQKEVAGRKK
ncbi:MAG: hypothetical protein COX81_02015 [Candidatus Magasanikbacteria bacterium CG_4_10_14_0_2_um_filter_37_12]|uniref:YtxH domain-containing protein n=1 Tax=Candidatus Magasanikbacteria bacterium CG_4_10_14_0_2_um_filter_37_12 TaxID=1974637 RepID=A0A2M7V8E4_9BACT|nr:MAG: hypothetical protein COX81_02015 [Candidatus Magasanikbacteria bacterium CG_4_10_14_0_2_um_filter_37_12]